MYSDRLAVAIQTNGKILREFGDTVFVPFGTEYSILIKNLNSVRCAVTISIDGDDVMSGGRFIVPANSSINIERFITSGNLSAGNRFKFIERTANVSAHRGGDRVDDGLIRIEYEFETVRPAPSIRRQPTWNEPTWNQLGNRLIDTAIDHIPTTWCNSPAHVDNYASVTYRSAATGITTKGSVSNQRFVDAAPIHTDGKPLSMVIRLRGETENSQVLEPITVKQKPKCTGCGRTNKSSSKFCAECGTSLIII